jgi:hypothetical protein
MARLPNVARQFGAMPDEAEGDKGVHDYLCDSTKAATINQKIAQAEKAAIPKLPAPATPTAIWTAIGSVIPMSPHHQSTNLSMISSLFQLMPQRIAAQTR